MAITDAQKNAIVSIYVGYFNRAPDPAGLQHYIDVMEARLAAGVSESEILDTMAVNFANSDEAKALYPFLVTPDVSTVNTFLESVYQNLFNRSPDTAGRDFWAGRLTDADNPLAPGIAIRKIIEGAQAGGTDKSILDNKIAAGLDFATDASNVAGFTFDAAAKSAAIAAIDSVDGTAASLTAAQTATDAFLLGAAGAGETFTLTTGVDELTGSTANDTFKAVLDGAATETLNVLDVIDGGAGDSDTLDIAASVAVVTADIPTTVSNVENITVRGTNTVTVDSSGIAGVTSLASTQSTTSTLTGAATTDVNVSGATGAITVNGGKDVVVNDATANTGITIGAGTVSAGSVTVTDTAQGTGNIAIDGGTSVTVNATGNGAGGGTITVGQGGAATDLPSGAVSVTHAHAATAGTDVALGAITVDGGSTVTVTRTADTSAAAADTTGATLTQGAVDVDGGDATTSVTITQAETVAEVVAVPGVAGVNATYSVTFVAMTAGQTATVDGLTFTASKALTAEEAAQAFANLSASDTQTASGPNANGVFTGATSANFTSGAASGAVVTFTGAAVGPLAAPAVGGTAGPAAAAGTTGVAATAAVTGVLGVNAGAVTVDDNATKSITDITIDGYGGATLGAGSSLDSLANLSLANSGAGATVLTSGSTSLNLAVNDVDAAVNVGASVQTLNLNAATEASAFALTGAAVKNIAIDAAVGLNLTGSALAALETASVTGAGAVNLGDVSGAAGLTAVNASAATGAVTVSVDGTVTDVTTGSGADAVTITTTGSDENFDLGAGDDTLTLGNAGVSTLPTGTVTGGAGTDTLAMNIATAAALDANTNLASAATSFERLSITDAGAGGEDINLANLGFSHVTTAGSGGLLTLSGLASGGTVVQTVAPTTGVTIGVTDASKNGADVANLVLQNDATTNFATTTVDDVETINITATDVFVDGNSDGVDDTDGDHTLTLAADAATSITVSGNSLNLTVTGATALATVNASGTDETFTYTADDGTTTVTGGSGNDVLTAAGASDVLIGGAGNDMLTGADLTTLTGGAGADTFVLNTPTNVNAYSTITDLTTGDIIDLGATATTAFGSAAINLAATAVFQDYANAAANSFGADDDDAAWFQFGGNTYIVKSGNNTPGNDFVNGSDSIIQITGLVDLSTASFNATNSTLEIA